MNILSSSDKDSISDIFDLYSGKELHSGNK